MVEKSILADHPLFAGASARDLDALERSARVRVFETDRIIFRQEDEGDGLYIVRSGTVKIVVSTAEGEESVIALMFPGDCFGELAVLDRGPRSASAIAVERTETLFIRRDDFLAFLERSPQVMMRIIRLLCQRLRRTDEQIADLVFFDVYGRVAKKLLELGRLHGIRTARGIEIKLPLTQQDLASLVGASRESVNKVMRFYRERGFVAVTNQRITILRPAALEQRIGAAIV